MPHREGRVKLSAEFVERAVLPEIVAERLAAILTEINARSANLRPGHAPMTRDALYEAVQGEAGQVNKGRRALALSLAEPSR